MVKGIVALVVGVTGKKTFVGNILKVDGKLILYRNFDSKTAILRKWNALSVDEKAYWFLKRNPQVEHVHYEDENGTLYVVSCEHYINNAVRGYNNAGYQWYLPISDWQKTQRNYETPYVKKERLLGDAIIPKFRR